MIETFKVLLIFALMVALLRKKLNLGLVMLVASLFLGLVFLLPPLEIGRVAVLAAVDPSTVTVVAALIIIMFLENVMRRTGLLQSMITSLSGVVGDHRIVMAALPAFIGLLPSAGGARFSAPMVEEACCDNTVAPERKSFINYWYRHLWEYVCPIYPGLIIGSQILNIPIRNMILTQLPFTFLAAVVAVPFGFAGMRELSEAPRDGFFWKHLKDLLLGLSPILAVLIMVIFLGLDVTLALGLAFVALLLVNRYSPRQVWQTIRESFSINIVLLVVGVMVFKAILVATGAVDSLPAFFSSLGVPVAGVVAILAFTVGILTGITQAAVGTSFPMLLGLSHGGDLNLWLVALTFVAGFGGVMLSPVHLCLVLSNQFFKADLGRVYRLILAPELVLVGAAVGLYFLMLR
jgi:uncharacterized protein